jgi:hypothetical protein
MTRCTFLLRQLTTTVAKPLHRRSARLAFPTPLRATQPIAGRTPARRRRAPSPLEFLRPGLETLPFPGEF